MKESVVVLLFAAVLAGCAAGGVKVSQQSLDTLRKGETTVDEALARLGLPTSRTRLPDGTQLLQYAYSEVAIKAASFIPVVGLVAGGSSIRTNVVTLKFQSDGRLESVSSSEGQYATGMGANAGTMNPQPVNQPRQ